MDDKYNKPYIARAENGTYHYSYQPIYDRQTGTNAEVVWIIGGKDIGKTFTLRHDLLQKRIDTGKCFVEVCRTDDEAKDVCNGYMSKLQEVGYFKEYIFRAEKKTLYYAKNTDNPKWEIAAYFVALTLFQKEKKRTYSNIGDFIFDEAIIDKKDRYHHYLPYEYSILVNLIDTITREQPNDTPQHKIYLLGNACDFSCPLLYDSGVRKIPPYGYSWYNHKCTLVHYVEPWDAEDRQARTLAGRMLANNDDEAAMIFSNKFSYGYRGDIERKTSTAKFSYAIVFMQKSFGIWIDYATGIFYVSSKVPRDARNVYALTKKDNEINRQMLKRTDGLLKTLSNIYYIGGVRYESEIVRETFMQVLEFLGVK